jgi:hypothetical protein
MAESPIKFFWSLFTGNIFLIRIPITTKNYLALLTWAFGIVGAAVGMTITGIVTALSYLLEIQKRLPLMRLSLHELWSYDVHDRKIVAVVVQYARKKLIPLAFQ